MSALPWFRLYSEFSHDSKVQMMSEPMQRRLVMLMCLRCSNALETLSDAEIAFHLRITMADLVETKKEFLDRFIDEKWNLLNWEKRQTSSDSSAERTRKYRERRAAAGLTKGSHKLANKSPYSRDGHTVTKKNACDGHGDALDKKRVEEKRKEQKQQPPVAVAPLFKLPDWISDDAWKGYEEMRRKIRRPLTDRARDGIVRDLDALRRIGHPPDAVLDQSTKHSWQGVFELRGGRNGSSQGHHANRAEQALHELAKAGVAFPDGRAEGGAGEDEPAPRGGHGQRSSGVVLEGTR